MSAAQKLGTIITTDDSPSITSFSFVINEKNPVKRGQFVSVETSEGIMIATVVNIFKTNRYFESAGSVKEYNKSAELQFAFPIKEWEYTIAEARALGVFTSDKRVERPSFPPSPGTDVTEVETDLLGNFLGLDREHGIELGDVQQHKLKAKFNLTKMIQKHIAVLAISGAGKSYAVSVLMEELLERTAKQGRVALLVIDNHGEYVSFAEDPNYKGSVKVIDADKIKIGVRNLTERIFASLLPNMSPAQVRVLGKILSGMKKAGEVFTIGDIIDAVKVNEDISKSTKEALMGWLFELEQMKIFDKLDEPSVEDLLAPGKMVIINLRNVLDLRKKQLIVAYISRRLFNFRREGRVPPYLEIIEEAHNYAPEKTKAENSLSKSIIETLAREGRKFFANLCLISQRPIQLSTTALSQCNTQIILKVTNPYDLDHIGKSSESLSKQVLDIISSLKVGEALVIGEATNYPVFVKIRQRRSKESHGTKLEDYAILWEKKAGGKLAKGSEFL